MEKQQCIKSTGLVPNIHSLLVHYQRKPQLRVAVKEMSNFRQGNPEHVLGEGMVWVAAWREGENNNDKRKHLHGIYYVQVPLGMPYTHSFI